MDHGHHLACLVGPACRPLRSLLRDVALDAVCIELDTIYDLAAQIGDEEPSSVWIDRATLESSDLGALRWLKNAHPRLRCVIVTEHRAGDDVVEELMPHGFDVLRSPIRARDVARIMSEHGHLDSDAESTLIAGLSDQLANPLAALVGRLQLIAFGLDEAEPKDVQDNLDLARKLALRMQSILAKLSRLTQRAKVSPTQTSWSALASVLRVRIADERLTIDEADEEGDELLIDQELVLTVLYCLIAVAMDLSGDGARLRARADKSDLVCEVELGQAVPLPCPPAELFAPYRCSRLLRDPDLGIDLSVASKLAQAMGGEVRIGTSGGFLEGFALIVPRRASGE